MGVVRTNITLPEDVLKQIDEVAGPRGRSRYIADVVAKQVRRDRARLVFEKYAGALAGSKTWGETPEDTLEIIRQLRDDSDRDRRVWGIWEEESGGEVSPGHNSVDRPRSRKADRGPTTRGAVPRSK